LQARQRLRVNAKLEVGELAQSVEVTSSAGVIATDTPAIASYLTANKVLDLPSNVRGAGSTSPYALLQTLPGVQADNGLGLSVQGGLPAQSESSVDGISITQVTGNSPNRNQFLSVESIGEIRVQGVGNTAAAVCMRAVCRRARGATSRGGGAVPAVVRTGCSASQRHGCGGMQPRGVLAVQARYRRIRRG